MKMKLKDIVPSKRVHGHVVLPDTFELSEKEINMIGTAIAMAYNVGGRNAITRLYSKIVTRGAYLDGLRRERAENKANPPRTALKRAKPSKADVLVDDFFASGMSAAQFFKRKA